MSLVTSLFLELFDDLVQITSLLITNQPIRPADNRQKTLEFMIINHDETDMHNTQHIACSLFSQPNNEYSEAVYLWHFKNVRKFMRHYLKKVSKALN